MKPIYPIRGVLAYYSPEKVAEKGIRWPDPPHVHFANLELDLNSLLHFDLQYGPLLREHVRMKPEMRRILDKVPNLTEQEQEQWGAVTSKDRFEISVSDADVQQARHMQEWLRQAWGGKSLAIETLQHGISHHAQQEAYGPARLTVAPGSQGVVIHAKDLWSFIRVAFLLDSERGQTKVCGNPSCPARFFLAGRKDQKFCERGDCTAYAQRKYALKWWNQEGKKRRAKKSSKRR